MNDEITISNETENVNVQVTEENPVIQDLDSIVLIEPIEQSVSIAPNVQSITVVSPGISGSGGAGSGGINVGDAIDKQFIVNNVPAGGSDQLDADPITNNKIGRLWMIDYNGSVPIKLDVEYVIGPRVIKASITKLAGNPEPWVPPDPRFMTLEGDGVVLFGCTVTNLSPHRTSDIKVTIYYDEVDN